MSTIELGNRLRFVRRCSSSLASTHRRRFGWSPTGAAEASQRWGVALRCHRCTADEEASIARTQHPNVWVLRRVSGYASNSELSFSAVSSDSNQSSVNQLYQSPRLDPNQSTKHHSVSTKNFRVYRGSCTAGRDLAVHAFQTQLSTSGHFKISKFLTPKVFWVSASWGHRCGRVCS